MNTFDDGSKGGSSPPAASGAASARGSVPRVSWKGLSALLLLPAATALLVAGVVCRGNGPSNLAQPSTLPPAVLAVLETLPAPLDRATELYRNGDYNGVQGLAQNVVQRSPEDPSIYLLLGSAQLLSGNEEDAAFSLRLVRDIEQPLLAEEARWQLAQAYLSVGELEPARDELAFLAQGNSARAAEAAAQLEQLAGRSMRR